MKRTDPVKLGELLDAYFQERTLRLASLEGRAVEVWAEVAGAYVAGCTEDVYIRRGVLYVSFSSAAVRAEMFIRRTATVAALNEKLGAAVVKRIVIR